MPTNQNLKSRGKTADLDELAEQLLGTQIASDIETIMDEALPFSDAKGKVIETILNRKSIERREMAAIAIALIMIFLLVIIILIAVLAPVMISDQQRLAAVSQTTSEVLPFVTGVVGWVFGHFFGPNGRLQSNQK